MRRRDSQCLRFPKATVLLKNAEMYFIKNKLCVKFKTAQSFTTHIHRSTVNYKLGVFLFDPLSESRGSILERKKHLKFRVNLDCRSTSIHRLLQPAVEMFSEGFVASSQCVKLKGSNSFEAWVIEMRQNNFEVHLSLSSVRRRMPKTKIVFWDGIEVTRLDLMSSVEKVKVWDPNDWMKRLVRFKLTWNFVE